MTRICKNCRFYRSPDLYDPFKIGAFWCSNIQSEHFKEAVTDDMTCDAFSSSKPAPWLALLNKAILELRHDK